MPPQWPRRLCEACLAGALVVFVLYLREQDHPISMQNDPPIEARAPETPAPRRTGAVPGPPYRLVIATIPRSGNGWIRGLLEAAVGVATMSVFPEGDAVYDSVTESYGMHVHSDAQMRVTATYRKCGESIKLPIWSFLSIYQVISIVYVNSAPSYILQAQSVAGWPIVRWCARRGVATPLLSRRTFPLPRSTIRASF
jgi:hypothetical protein